MYSIVVYEYTHCTLLYNLCTAPHWNTVDGALEIPVWTGNGKELLLLLGRNLFIEFLEII